MKLACRLFAVTIAALLVPLVQIARAEEPSGTVRISQVQVALLVSGNLGGGDLTFQGRTYAFTIGGLGYGGIGASKLKAQGEVYGLTNVKDFEGVYVQARTGAVAGTENAGKGGMWLSNSKGVRMRLQSQREGLALALGGDAVVVEFKK